MDPSQTQRIVQHSVDREEGLETMYFFRHQFRRRCLLPGRFPLVASIAAFVLGSIGFPGAATPASAVAALLVTPATSVPGSPVHVTGTGFAGRSLMAVWADFRTAAGVRRATATVHTSGTGTFAAQLPVPASALPAGYPVIASDFTGHRATGVLRVVTGVMLRQGNSATAASAVAGSSFLVLGTGFAPGMLTLRVTFALFSGTPVVLRRQGQVGPTGAFRGTWIGVPAGARTGMVTATDSIGQSGRGLVRVEYRPVVSVHPSPIPADSPFLVNGSGFLPGSQVTFTFARPGSALPAYSGMTSAGKAGRIQAAVHPGPSLPPGTYILVAATRDGSARARSTVVVTGGPSLSASVPAVEPGGVTVVEGYHFPPFAHVELRAAFPQPTGISRTVAFNVTAGRFGNFRAPLHVPATASPGTVRVRAGTRGVTADTAIRVIPGGRRLSVAPMPGAPGETVTVSGSGFPGRVMVSVSATVLLTDGTSASLSASPVTDSRGAFAVSLLLPPNAAPGTYQVTATSEGSGANAITRMIVSPVSPTIVALPRAAAPGTSVTVNGFGFPTGATVQVGVQSGATVIAAVDRNGRFFASVIVPLSAPPGRAFITASVGSTSASFPIDVAGAHETHAYFPSLYTGVGYHEYIDLLNPTEGEATVGITYLRDDHSPLTVSLTVPAHTRVTHDVNADLGVHASAAAIVTSTGAIVAERLMRHHTDVAVDDGAASPSSTWLFAWGNTSHGYREYLSVENPNKRPAEVAFLFMPSHNRQFTLFKSVSALSRMTLNVGLYVPNDSVSVQVMSARPVVANRSVFVGDGVSSKTGVAAGSKTWYFAAGPRQPRAVNWISVLNPGPTATTVSLTIYGLHGALLRVLHQRVGPSVQAAYLMNRLAQHTDVSVVVTAPIPIVAEQMTYVGRRHDNTTDVFGMPAPVRSTSFAAIGTRTDMGEADAIDVFNPSAVPVASVVEFVTASGASTQQTVITGPRARTIVDVGEAVSNVQLGAVLVSGSPVVALNRYSIDKGIAGDTSVGLQEPVG